MEAIQSYVDVYTVEQEQRHKRAEAAIAELAAAVSKLKEYRGKYTLDRHEPRKQGASGIVLFGTSTVSGQRVALKFYLNR